MPAQRRLARNEILFRQGDPPGPLFVLREGRLSVVEDDVQIAEIDESGSVLGEMSKLLGEPRTADVVALSECTLDEVEDVDGWLRADPERAVDLIRTLARRLVAMDRAFVDARRALARAGGRLEHDETYLPPELDPVRRYFRALGIGT